MTQEELKKLEKNEHLISEKKVDEEGNEYREVNGKKVIQIKEETERDKELNRTINLWRMRNI